MHHSADGKARALLLVHVVSNDAFAVKVAAACVFVWEYVSCYSLPGSSTTAAVYKYCVLLNVCS